MQVLIGKGRRKSHIIISVLMTHCFFLVLVQSPPGAERYVLGVLLHVEDLHDYDFACTHTLGVSVLPPIAFAKGSQTSLFHL
jgi:hypothetical protein